jgi:CubicO group peptidase (beta-lactamase class C family)
VAAVYSDLGYLVLGAIVERAANAPLETAFVDLVANPLGLGARYAGTRESPDALRETGDSVVAVRDPRGPNVAATEIDDRTGASAVVQGRVHDENAWYGGGVCGHAGLFARLDDVATFAAAIVDTAAGLPRGRLRTEVVNHFLSTAAAPGASWRLGWDTPSSTPGVSHAGDRWPRTASAGHLGFTGVSLWLDLPRRRWVTLLTNRVHPTRFGDSPDAIKQLRRQVNDLSIQLLDGRDE